MEQAEKVYTLTGEQLTELCVRFGVFMGWTRGPGSQVWRDDLRHCTSAKSVHDYGVLSREKPHGRQIATPVPRCHQQSVRSSCRRSMRGSSV
jgi:hypothetical protein